ncbi:hypothetical protein Hanom_Chr02g00176261 [Helianthus anomalus]
MWAPFGDARPPTPPPRSCSGDVFFSGSIPSSLRVSMAKFVHADVVEQILLRSEVKDLIRFKSVLKYRLLTKAGILCNGGCSLLVHILEDRRIIRYMGVMEGCLCIFWRLQPSCVVIGPTEKYNNVKQSWEPLSQYDSNMNYDSIHYLRRPTNHTFNESFFHPDEPWFNGTFGYIDSPVFVQSLVSPHVYGRPM